MNRPVVLDASFLVALERETMRGEQGPARRFLASLRVRRLVVPIVTVEELLEGQPTKRRLWRHCSGSRSMDCNWHSAAVRTFTASGGTPYGRE